jgi:hypothetical protein
VAEKQHVEVERRSIALSNLDKVLYPAGFTKAQVIDYYIRIAPWLLPHYARRPVTLKRFPDGAHAKAFYEKDAPKDTPDCANLNPWPEKPAEFARPTCLARRVVSRSGTFASTICPRSCGARTRRAWSFIPSVLVDLIAQDRWSLI